MPIVVLIDPLYLQWASEPWHIERNNLNLVADFEISLP